MNVTKVLIMTIVIFSWACNSNNAVPVNQNVTYSPKDTQIFRIPAAIGYVNDFDHVFSDSQVHILDSVIIDFEKRTTNQIAIATIPLNMVSIDSFEVFTLKMANQWGVGQKGKDNGILIAIGFEHRFMRIQNGIGIEKILSDSTTKTIIDNDFKPYFMRSDYFEGTLSGLQAIIRKLDSLQGRG